MHAAAAPALDPTGPIAAVTHADPYPYYARLAQRDGLWPDPASGLHVASSPAAVRAVLGHPALRVRPPDEPVPRHLVDTVAGDWFGRLVRMNDGAAQAPLKALLQRALATESTGAVAAAAARAAASRFDALDLRRDPRGIDAWVRSVPVLAVADRAGFDLADPDALLRDVEALVAGIAPGSVDATRTAAAAAAASALVARAERALAAPPPSSIAAHLAEADAPRDALAANLVGLLTQAFEATAALLGNALLALARGGVRIDDAGALHRHVAAVSHADPGIHNTRRFAGADCNLLGTRLARGSGVLVLLVAAAGVPFGHGVHACPGADAAVTIAAAALHALQRAGFDVRALPTTVRYRPSPNARMPLFFTSEERGR